MTTEQENQIYKLTTLVKARIAPSKIHGVGVFALVDLQKGQRLYADQVPTVFSISYTNLKKLEPEVRELILERFPQIFNGSKFVWPTERLQGFMNHGGDESNYDPFSDEIMKDIKKGTEILEDYRLIKNYQKVFTWLK